MIDFVSGMTLLVTVFAAVVTLIVAGGRNDDR